MEYKLGKEDRHTETECPENMSLHARRNSIVCEELDFASYIAYSALRTKSEIARYLCKRRIFFTNGKISHDFFSDEDAKKSLSSELNTFKSYINSLYPIK
ncbi:MAG: hypothetical protein HQ538_05895 [Parcubacteria group bacterium]|nr:hypothetical protein [Parcubacteria group bacterium]